jgi:hypothetical protein
VPLKSGADRGSVDVESSSNSSRQPHDDGWPFSQKPMDAGGIGGILDIPRPDRYD